MDQNWNNLNGNNESITDDQFRIEKYKLPMTNHEMNNQRDISQQI